MIELFDNSCDRSEEMQKAIDNVVISVESAEWLIIMTQFSDFCSHISAALKALFGAEGAERLFKERFEEPMKKIGLEIEENILFTLELSRYDYITTEDKNNEEGHETN